MFLKRGLLFFIALAFLAFAGQASAGPNANAVLSVDIDASDNKMNDGNTSGTAVAGTDVVVEIFISGLAGPIVGGVVTFDTDKLTVKSAAPAAGFFALGTTANTVSLGAVPSGTLTNDYFGTVTLAPVEGLMVSTEFTVGVSVKSLADAADPTNTDDITTAMMVPLSFNAIPRLEADATVVSVPAGSTGKAVVTAVNFAADATITFDVQGEMIEQVMSMMDGATLTLTASGPAKAIVTASDGMITTDPITIEFVSVKFPALDAVVGMDMMNMMDDGMMAASAGAEEEIAIEVFAGDIEGGIGGASIAFAIEPASAASITGFAPAEGLTLLGISGNMVDVGAEQGVMLSSGFLGTLKLMTGSEAVAFTVGVSSFTVLLGSGETTMVTLPAPVMYNFGPRLEVSASIATIPRGGEATIKITALGFDESMKITFSHTVEGTALVDGHPEVDMLHVYKLTATGSGSAVVTVTAGDGMASVEVTVQFDEQVPIELSSFVGSVMEDRVVLNWATASQTNNVGFRVLRSTDGETYEVVSELIAGAGTTDQLMDYMFEDTGVPAVEVVYYVLEQIDLDGSVNLSNPIEVLLGARFTPPTEFASTVYPNPFNPRTTISYDLPADTDVSIVIYNETGQEIRHLVTQHYTAGRYSVQWDAKDYLGRSVGSGVYIAKIVAGPNTAIQKMLLLK
jgi:hypothetical protein